MNAVYGPYRYVKSSNATVPQPITRRYGQFLALGCVVIGGIILAATFLPIATWQITSSTAQELVFPVQPGAVSSNSQSGSVLAVSTKSQPQSTVKVRKLADGFSYFTTDSVPKQASYDHFTVSIPKIDIESANAIVNSNDFDTHLGHLPGSALPGTIGNVFITGHSALPSFYSQTNYKTNFTHLPDLNLFDEIDVTANHTLFRYSIEKRFIVDPSDVAVINPPDPFGKYLTLMTCVPPGLNAQRLIIQARLIE